MGNNFYNIIENNLTIIIQLERFGDFVFVLIYFFITRVTTNYQFTILRYNLIGQFINNLK